MAPRLAGSQTLSRLLARTRQECRRLRVAYLWMPRTCASRFLRGVRRLDFGLSSAARTLFFWDASFVPESVVLSLVSVLSAVFFAAARLALAALTLSFAVLLAPASPLTSLVSDVFAEAFLVAARLALAALTLSLAVLRRPVEASSFVGVARVCVVSALEVAVSPASFSCATAAVSCAAESDASEA